MRQITLTILFVLLLALPLMGTTTYYVATDGNNTDTGGISDPWQTIDYAQGKLVAGDTLYIRDGRYRELVNIDNDIKGVSGNWITISGYPGETAIVDGSEVLTGWTQCVSDEAWLTVDSTTNPNYSSIYWTTVEASEFFDSDELAKQPFVEDGVRAFLCSDVRQISPFEGDRHTYTLVDSSCYSQSVYMDDTDLDQADDYWNTSLYGTIVDLYLSSYNNNIVQMLVDDFSTGRVTFTSTTPAVISDEDSYRMINHPSLITQSGDYYITPEYNEDGTDYRRIYYWPTDASNLTSNVSLATRDHCITQIYGYDAYIKIQNMEFCYCTDKALEFKGAASPIGYVTLENLTVHDTGGFGMHFGLSAETTEAQNCIVKDCNVYHTGSIGIYMIGSDNTTNGNYAGPCGSTAISMKEGDNNQCIYNRITGSESTHAEGMSMYGSYNLPQLTNSLIAGNELTNCNIAFNSCENVVVFGNLVIYDTEISPELNAFTPWTASRYDGYWLFAHNTGAHGNTYGLNVPAAGRTYSQSGEMVQNYLTNNCLYGMNKFDDSTWDIPDTNNVEYVVKTYNAYTFKSLHMQVSSGWSYNVGEVNIIGTDLSTQFASIDYNEPDYTPKTTGDLYEAGNDVTALLTSLGIQAAFPLYDFTEDLYGNTWNSTPSIGAVENAGEAPVTHGPFLLGVMQ